MRHAPRSLIAWREQVAAPQNAFCLPAGAAEIQLGRQAMFEDSTFESNSRIHTRSRTWMLATCAFNGSILLAMILVPLIYPSALPQMVKSFLVEAPAPPQPEPKPVEVAMVTNAPAQIQGGHIFAPRLIPEKTFIPETPEVTRPVNVANADLGDKPDSGIFNSAAHHTEVRPAAIAPLRVSENVEEGLIIQRTIPTYPPIARASGIEGTVVLQATISRTGTIANLRVISGPLMLQQAAINAVQQWRYRPYLLSGEPVEVETTVNVIFKLN
jgi:protein TonB